VDRWEEGWVEGMGGWVESEGWVALRVGFNYINDMYNNDVGEGGVRVYEAYEVK
jgi:hypothetical protein